MQSFYRILMWQYATYFVLAVLTGFSLWGHDGWLSALISKEHVPLVIGFVVSVVIVQFLGNIWHELVEINDQLAGRSPELHKIFRTGQ